ncbi:MAG: hypothetical protein WD845_12715 [Pirellulales bacterium]
MKVALGSLTLLVALASLSGCRMCQSPFDYCNPMIGPSGTLNCDFQARRNSVFHPMDDDPEQRLVKAVPQQPGTTYEMGVPDPAAERGYDPSARATDDETVLE